MGRLSYERSCDKEMERESKSMIWEREIKIESKREWVLEYDMRAREKAWNEREANLYFIYCMRIRRGLGEA